MVKRIKFRRLLLNMKAKSCVPFGLRGHLTSDFVLYCCCPMPSHLGYFSSLAVRFLLTWKISPHWLSHSTSPGRYLLNGCPIPPHLGYFFSLAVPFLLTWKISPHWLSHSSSPGRFILIGCPIPHHREDFSSLAVPFLLTWKISPHWLSHSSSP
jgi:hypothetical protein